MTIAIRLASALLITGMSFTMTLALGEEVTDEMRTFGLMVASLEARDLKNYCATMTHAPAYAGYVNRVCQYEIKNRMKKPEDCTPEKIADQIKADNVRCLAMPAAEFEKAALRSAETGKVFIRKLAEKGVDGEKLLREERILMAAGNDTNSRAEQGRDYVIRERLSTCCARPERRPADWVEIGGDADQTHYLDRNSIFRSERYVSATILSDFRAVQTIAGQKQVHSAKKFWRYSCGERTEGNFGVTLFSGRMGTGTVLTSWSSPEESAAMQPIADPAISGGFRVACGIKP